MPEFIKVWLQRMWRYDVDRGALIDAYRAVPDLVLQDLVDKFLFVDGVPQSSDAALINQGAQAVVIKVLQDVDVARRPEKYRQTNRKASNARYPQDVPVR